MALTNEDLQALSDMIDNKLDQKLEPINTRLDKIENRLDKIENRLDIMENRLDKMENRLEIMELRQNRTSKKLDDLQLDVKIAERDIRRDILSLKDEMETVVDVLRQNELIPR